MLRVGVWSDATPGEKDADERAVARRELRPVVFDGDASEPPETVPLETVLDVPWSDLVLRDQAPR